MGRDAAGRVWFDDLQVRAEDAPYAALAAPCATVGGRPGRQARPHASHKGSYGDVAVVGGAPGMAGAALLAASAALHYGAGRVYLAALDPSLSAAALSGQPELMLRATRDIDLGRCTVVCGCGGGDAVRAEMPRVLAGAARLVLDADALNSLAPLTQHFTDREVILTPHVGEFRRLFPLLDPADRFTAIHAAAAACHATIVLKGARTVITKTETWVNALSTPALARAGSGDVLAGMIGGLLAQGSTGAALAAVWWHSHTARMLAAKRSVLGVDPLTLALNLNTALVIDTP
jgi:hydroxyethylthiazole kinase-like uncharacterized protein yjeF